MAKKKSGPHWGLTEDELQKLIDGPPSKVVTDPIDLMKFKLIGVFSKLTDNMNPSEITQKTGLDKSDVSRLLMWDLKRFSLERILRILYSLGATAEIKTNISSKPKKAS